MLKTKDPLQKKIVSIEGTMDSAIKKIKETMISGKEIEATYNDILQSCEGLMEEMKQQQEKERREEEEVCSATLMYNTIMVEVKSFEEVLVSVDNLYM